MIGNILVGLVALIHLFIVYLEMVAWDTPRGHRAFNLKPDFASASKVLAANQGLYNGFLAAGLIWGLYLGAADSRSRCSSCFASPSPASMARRLPAGRSSIFRPCRRCWPSLRCGWAGDKKDALGARSGGVRQSLPHSWRYQSGSQPFG